MTGVAARRAAMASTLVDALHEAGADVMCGVPGGGSNLDVVGAAVDRGWRFVLAHTEGAAAITAAVVGELTGSPGACVVTRGPGLASVVNGSAQALLDRQPLVIVSDCVADIDRARISHQRLDQRALMAPVAVASLRYGPDDHDVPAEAVRIALGRVGPSEVGPPPGPVHLDFDDTAAGRSPVAGSARPLTAGAAAIDDVLARSRRPVVIVGHGARARGPVGAAGVATALDRLGRTRGVPMLTTYRAHGVVPASADWNAGVATGAVIEGEVLDAADLVIGVGLDPVELIPGPWRHAVPVLLLGSWPVDDSAYFQSSLAGEVVAADLGELIDEVTDQVRSDWEPASGAVFRQRGLDRLRAAAAVVNVDASVASSSMSPLDVVMTAAASVPEGSIVTVDAGAHMLLAVPFWPAERPGELLISNGLATMGYALPAATAAALVHPDRPVVCLTGDGGLGMVLAELETLVRHDLHVVVVVFDDASLSLIAAKQRQAGHGGAAAVSYRPIDFAGVARSVGMVGVSAVDGDDLAAQLAAALARRGPTLIDVAVDPTCYPAVLDAIRAAR